jgi:hypothetical protein
MGWALLMIYQTTRSENHRSRTARNWNGCAARCVDHASVPEICGEPQVEFDGLSQRGAGPWHGTAAHGVGDVVGPVRHFRDAGPRLRRNCDTNDDARWRFDPDVIDLDRMVEDRNDEHEQAEQENARSYEPTPSRTAPLCPGQLLGGLLVIQTICKRNRLRQVDVRAKPKAGCRFTVR